MPPFVPNPIKDALVKSYGNVSTALRILKETNNNVTLKQVQEYKKTMRDSNIYAPNVGKNSFMPPRPLFKFECDVADFTNYRKHGLKREKLKDKNPEEKEEARYLFVAIDIFTKFCYGKVMPDKSAESCADALQSAITEMGLPTYVRSDRALEFKTGFKDVCDKNNIEHLTTHYHCGYIERLIRTLKTKVRFRQSFKSVKWTNIINDVIKAYNGDKHSVIKMTPNKAVKEDENKKILENIKEKAKQPVTYRKIEIGDYVRTVVKSNNSMEKKTHVPRWSTDLYKVVDILKDGQMMMTVFKLEGLKDTYNRSEVRLDNGENVVKEKK